MYLKMAVEEDKIMADNLKADADRILIFSGLFSAVVAVLLTVSVRDLRPDPQDRPTFYLENIYQLLANPNTTHVPTLPTQSIPPAFSPPKSAVWVNLLWSLSLVIALSCALLAVLLQQWARRYIKITQPRSASSLHKRARMRAFFDKGVEELHFQWAVDTLPILLHASLVLFLAGFVVFSFNSNHTVFKVVVSWVGFCALTYACFTVFPIFRLESPYYTPLSSPLWLLYTGAQYIVVRSLHWFTAFHCCSDETWVRFGDLQNRYRRRLLHGIEEAAEESAQKISSEIDSRVLLWTLQASDEDHELERFFESIPDFCGSKVLEDPLGSFKGSNSEKMADALVGLLDRTLSSDLLPLSTKQRRIMICNRAMTEASLTINRRTLERVLYNDWGGLLGSVQFGLLLKNSCYSDPFAEYYSQCVISVIIAWAQEHDDCWFELATSQFGVTKVTLQNYLAHGDSLLLANCIFVCRRTMEGYSEHGWHRDVYARSKTLELVSRFNIQDTLPVLQHEFCDMWNELVRNAGSRYSQNLSIHILKHIRNVYFALHQGSSAAPTAFSSATSDRDSILLFPLSYPLCKIARHCPEKEPSYNDVPSAPPDPTQVPTPAYTPRVILAKSKSCRLMPALPFPETFGVMQEDARTYTPSSSPNATPHSTYAADPRPPSYLWSSVYDHHTETAPNSLATSAATARLARTSPASSPFMLCQGAIHGTIAPLATYDAPLIPAANADHAGIISVDMQPVDELSALSPISISLPARAVVRISHDKDNPRLNRLLADITRDTNNPASSTASSVPTYLRSLTTASSSIGTGAFVDSEVRHVVPAYEVLDKPSPALPIPVLGHTIPICSGFRSSPTSSMSRSGGVPSGTRLLATNSATTFHLATPGYTTVPLRQQQPAPLLPAITPDCPRFNTSHSFT
jgi:hypothetical protein